MAEDTDNRLSTAPPEKIKFPSGSRIIDQFLISPDDPDMDPGIAEMLNSDADILKQRKSTDTEHYYEVWKAPDGGYYGKITTQRKGENPMEQSVIFNKEGFSLSEEQLKTLRDRREKLKPPAPPRLP